MKVNNNSHSNPAVSVENSKNIEKKSQASEKNALIGDKSGASRPEVEISDSARLMHTAVQLAKDANPNRPERVAELKRNIQNGTYQVKSADVAEKLLEEHLSTDFGKNSL